MIYFLESSRYVIFLASFYCEAEKETSFSALIYAKLSQPTLNLHMFDREAEFELCHRSFKPETGKTKNRKYDFVLFSRRSVETDLN